MPPVSSSSSRTLRSRLRPVFLSALAATAVGGTALYISIRPRNIPGSDPGLVPPPKYGEEGVLEPPRFPKVRGRGEQIRRLKKSAGRGQADAEGEAKEGLWGKFRGRFGGNPNSLDTGGQEEEQEDDERVMTERNGDIDGQPYDLLIIGGGATGAGIALDAVTRGLKVALVEKDDFASGTSSKSTKLVHGGVRYLEKAVWDLDYNQYRSLAPLISFLPCLEWQRRGKREGNATDMIDIGTSLCARLSVNANTFLKQRLIYLCGFPS